MPAIFVSYRRADAVGTAGRLFDRLSQRFGEAQVFRDIESIEAGEDFEEAIRDAFRTATAVLVVIGPRWLDLGKADGSRRLDDPHDYVRREIEAALPSDAGVIPVLIEGASMPQADALPASLRELTKRNAVILSDLDWEDEIARLLRQLETRGIRPESASAARDDAPAESGWRSAARTTVALVPDFLSLLFQPRRFLARRTAGKDASVAGAVAYFAIAVVLAVAIVLSAYTPSQSVASFGLTVMVMGLVVTLAASGPLWIAWRAVGARHHYRRLLIVLLHQSAVLHLMILIAVWMVLVGLDLSSRNVMRDTIDAGMRPGASLEAALDLIRTRLVPLVAAPEVRISLALGTLTVLAAVAWTYASWGAYRDAFGLTRARSALAVFLLVVMIAAVAALIQGAG
jgi:hypothetical protein